MMNLNLILNSKQNKNFLYEILKQVRNPSVDLRHIDGMISLSLSKYDDKNKNFLMGDSVFALVMPSSRTYPHTDTMELSNPYGNGFVLLNVAMVPHFTTRIDDAISLLDDVKWSVSSDGTAKCFYPKLKEKLKTPALSLCAIGLLLATFPSFK